MKNFLFATLCITSIFLVSCDESDDKDPVSQNHNIVLDSPGASYYLDGNLIEVDSVLIQANAPVADYLIITLPLAHDFQLRMLPNATGTYNVGEGPNQFRLVDIWFRDSEGGWFYANDSVGSGFITLDDIGILTSNYSGTIKGKFEGTVVNSEGEVHNITNGQFWTKTY